MPHVTAVVVGAIVGVGIFFTPSVVAREVPSAGALLGVWALAGVLSAWGALTLAELGGRVPEDGGVYAFLRRGFGPRAGALLAFLFGWTNLLVMQPGSIAVVSLVLALNVSHLVGGLSQPAMIAVAALTVATSAAINAAGVRVGGGVQIGVAALKIAAVGGLAGLGLASGEATHLATGGASVGLGAVTAGLIPALFSYAGWQQGSYIAGRVRRPEVAVPVGIALGIAVVIALYVSVNAGYLALLGLEGMARSDALAADAAAVLLGPRAGDVLAVVVAVSAAGVVHTLLLAFPWVLHAMSRDGLFLRGLGAVHPRTGSPIGAIVALAAWSIVGTLLGPARIDSLIAGMAFAEWSFLTLAGVALLRLRRTTPSPPVRLPGPLVVGFCGMGASLAVGALVVKPVESAFGLLVMAAGAAAYLRARPG